MRPPRLLLSLDTPAREGHERLTEAGLTGAAVTDGDRVFRGTIDAKRLERADPEQPVRAITDGTVSAVPVAATLDAAAEVFATEHATWVPVLDEERRVVGTVDTADLVHAYRRSLASSLDSLSGILPGSVLIEEEVHPSSEAIGQTTSASAWPAGTVVVAIQRGEQLIFPEPTSVIVERDVLSVLVPTGSESRLRQMLGSPEIESSAEDAPMI